MNVDRATTQRRFAHLGLHAGLGVYHPRNRKDLKLELYEAIGQTIDLNFAGVARADERFAGQNLYQERASGHLLQSSWVPEQDVQFLEPDRKALTSLRASVASTHQQRSTVFDERRSGDDRRRSARNGR